MKAQSSLQQPQVSEMRIDRATGACGSHSCSLWCQINKCLKALEHRKLVKAVKSVANGNRKVYMLFELEPSREITGGAWCVALL